MSGEALTDALSASRSRAIAALGKAYIRRTDEPDDAFFRGLMHEIGLDDDVAISFLLASWAILRTEKAAPPAETASSAKQAEGASDAQGPGSRVRLRACEAATTATWERLREEKGSSCRICGQTDPAVLHLHHIVHRDDRGDDTADNLAPLCQDCHRGVHLREPAHCRLLLSRLSDAEYAYAVTRGGEDYFERVYGISYDRGGFPSEGRRHG